MFVAFGKDDKEVELRPTHKSGELSGNCRGLASPYAADWPETATQVVANQAQGTGQLQFTQELA